MATYPIPSIHVAFISDLDQYQNNGICIYVDEDNGVYQRYGTWSRICDWPGGGGAAQASGPPTGAIFQWPTANAPTGYLLADGAVVSRTTYSALFAVIGVIYGAGDGSTTFGLPNLKGRVPVGLDAGQTEFDTLGETGGAKTHTLTAAEMPAHTHVQDAHTHVQNSHNHTQDAHNHTQNAHNHGLSEGQTDGAGSFMDRSNAASATTAVTDNATATNIAATATNQVATAVNQNATATNQNTGGGGAHNNLQPFIVLNFIIKT